MGMPLECIHFDKMRHLNFYIWPDFILVNCCFLLWWSNFDRTYPFINEAIKYETAVSGHWTIEPGLWFMRKNKQCEPEYSHRLLLSGGTSQIAEKERNSSNAGAEREVIWKSEVCRFKGQSIREEETAWRKNSKIYIKVPLKVLCWRSNYSCLKGDLHGSWAEKQPRNCKLKRS